MGSQEDWKNWRDLLMREIREMRKEQTKIQIEIATLKVKSSLWGFAAGAIPTLLLYLKTAK